LGSGGLVLRDGLLQWYRSALLDDSLPWCRLYLLARGDFGLDLSVCLICCLLSFVLC
jgi:hypothetical protein